MVHVHSTILLFVLSVASLVAADHTFIFKNKCHYAVKPVVANTNCGYSPRCSTPGSGGVPKPAVSFKGAQPGTVIASRGTKSVKVNRQFNGRVFNQNGHCGAKGEGCSMAEFNLDTGGKWTPHAYDLSNIQGFTQSMSIAVSSGCQSVICTSKSCSCKNAYRIGDMSGCGNDSPVRGCSAGDKTWTITFCP